MLLLFSLNVIQYTIQFAAESTKCTELAVQGKLTSTKDTIIGGYFLRCINQVAVVGLAFSGILAEALYGESIF